MFELTRDAEHPSAEGRPDRWMHEGALKGTGMHITAIIPALDEEAEIGQPLVDGRADLVLGSSEWS